ncbi:flagellar protein, FliL [Methanobrevibacter sp.]|uniref:flagellar protein, FliL n=1 Tax=Methanobrevibacter sp. TaxID=66852 RepID=UPI00388DBDEE
MKGLIIVVLVAIAALLVVGGAVGYTLIKETSIGDDASIDEVVDKVSSVATSTGSDEASSDSDIVSEVVKFNAQQGEGYYREVTYKDGGFRQFDVDTDELIGSSYDSDQQYLPSME